MGIKNEKGVDFMNKNWEIPVRIISLGAILLLVVLIISWSVGSGTHVGAKAKPSEQVIFSGTGTFDSSSPLAGSDFGFWVWCEADSENPYDGECNGAMYIYALGLTKHVEGEIEEIETPNGDEYQMTVASTKDNTLAAVLRNVAPEQRGPRNTVNVTFTTPNSVGGGSSTRAVVNVTGPGD